jgi:hypothetical protein
MKNLVRKIKKLKSKPGDILVVTLKGYPTRLDLALAHDEFASMPFLKGTNVIFTTDSVDMKYEKPQKGKHKVYLNNLEYLEYMSKQKGE